MNTLLVPLMPNSGSFSVSFEVAAPGERAHRSRIGPLTAPNVRKIDGIFVAQRRQAASLDFGEIEIFMS